MKWNVLEKLKTKLTQKPELDKELAEIKAQMKEEKALFTATRKPRKSRQPSLELVK